MASSISMIKVDILVLKKHVDEVASSLGFSESLEIIESSTQDDRIFYSKSSYLNKINELRNRLNTLIHEMKIVFNEDELIKHKDFSLEIDEIEQNISKIEEEINDKLVQLKDLEKARIDLENMFKELSSFGYIDVDLSKLSDFDATYIAYGTINKNGQKLLEKESTDRMLFIPVSTENDYICISSKKGKWALETTLKKIGFERKELEFFKHKTIKTILQETENKLNNLNNSYKEASKLVEDYKQTRLNDIIKLQLSLNIKQDVDSFLEKFRNTEKVYHISGWLESKRLDEITNAIMNITNNAYYILVTDPKELPGYAKGEIKVPIKLKKRRFISNFEILVKNYGLPEYGEVDPTFIVAITFLAMFGIMFGDVGQGFVFFILGIIMKLNKIKFLNKFAHLGILFMGMGIFSMIFGALYGSYFGMEHFIKPLFVSPMVGFMKIFLIAISFGCVFLAFGVTINIYNTLSKRNYFNAFFDKTGIFGLWFYLGCVTMVIRSLVLKKPFNANNFDVLILIITPLILLFLKSPFHWIIEKKKGHSKEGLISVILESIIETIELITYYLGNTASFMRMGALALAHASLSFAIFTIAGLLKGSFMGNVFAIIIIIIGNLFIIVLEGLVASIQTMRLQYYEFFSKFYSGSGKGFAPFKIEKIKKIT